MIKRKRVKHEINTYNKWYDAITWLKSENPEKSNKPARRPVGIQYSYYEEDEDLMPMICTWPSCLHIPSGLLRRHPNLRSKLRVDGCETMAGFIRNLNTILSVIRRSVKRLEKEHALLEKKER